MLSLFWRTRTQAVITQMFQTEVVKTPFEKEKKNITWLLLESRTKSPQTLLCQNKNKKRLQAPKSTYVKLTYINMKLALGFLLPSWRLTVWCRLTAACFSAIWKYICPNYKRISPEGSQEQTEAHTEHLYICFSTPVGPFQLSNKQYEKNIIIMKPSWRNKQDVVNLGLSELKLVKASFNFFFNQKFI